MMGSQQLQSLTTCSPSEPRLVSSCYPSSNTTFIWMSTTHLLGFMAVSFIVKTLSHCQNLSTYKHKHLAKYLKLLHGSVLRTHAHTNTHHENIKQMLTKKNTFSQLDANELNHTYSFLCFYQLAV